MQRPLPAQRPHPPIVVGGSSPAAYRRAIRAANGFYGHNLDLEQTTRVLGEIRRLSTEVDRPAVLGDLEISITPRELVDLDTARRYADLGVHRLLVLPRDLDSPDAAESLIGTLGETVVGRV